MEWKAQRLRQEAKFLNREYVTRRGSDPRFRGRKGYGGERKGKDVQGSRRTRLPERGARRPAAAWGRESECAPCFPI